MTFISTILLFEVACQELCRAPFNGGARSRILIRGWDESDEIYLLITMLSFLFCSGHAYSNFSPN